MLLKAKGTLQQEGQSYWFSFKPDFSIEVVKCTTKVGEGEYLLFVSFDNDLHVFLFSNEEELGLFQVLKNVKGVGNVKASRILSLYDVQELLDMIKDGHEEQLALLPGIGERTAKRIVVELSGHFKNNDHAVDDSFTETVNAACDLGYDRKVVTELLRRSSEWRNKNLEDALRWLIKELNQKA
ncbi:MAG TPA: helix-hairpin-helix domain-containing protein [Coprothermobacter proteolyticus]|nr:helix-hairpin-helix domain-containing protein [Coprothermobacter proteolyticus]